MLQRTDEWLLARVGKATASRIHDIAAATKSGGYTAGRKNYLAELVAERLSGLPYPQYVNAAMNHGTEHEPEARFRYALESGLEIEEVGFIPHPRLAHAGASPDGLVGRDGLCEIKCPHSPGTHLDTLLGDKVEPKYISQMQFQMSCTGRQWCDFVSYDPRGLPEEMQLKIIRVERDDKAIAKLEAEVEQFLRDVADTVALLRERYQVPT